MKKVLLAFAIASVFAACGDSSTDSTTTTDSTNVQVDSSAITPALPDTTLVDTSANRMSADTTRR